MAAKTREGRKLLVASIGVAAVSYVACGGSTTNSTTQGHGAGGSSDAGENMGIGGNIVVSNLAAPCPPSDVRVGQSTPVEMTNAQYDHTVRDLLGDTSGPSKEFPPEEIQNGFKRVLAGNPNRKASYDKAAAEIADAAIARLDAVLPCSPATAGEEACVTQFITTFGKRAFRRPLLDVEQASLYQAYVDARAAGDFASGTRAVIFAALTSPHFYQIEEKGTSSSPVLLDPYAIASRLSYFVLGSMPDAALFAAADANQLATREGITAQVQRMLKDPRAHEAVVDFFRQWLRLDRLLGAEKSTELLANFASVRDSMITETTMFAESIFFGDGSYKSLLTSPLTWANADIAAIYGEPFTGTGFQQLKLDGSIRAGVLTQPSILSLTTGPEQSSPSRRGSFVLEALLCQPIPVPPNHPDLTDVLTPRPGTSTRQRYQRATETTAMCSACHRFFDQLGYGLEAFDAVGRYRTLDNGVVIEPYGDIAFNGINFSFLNAVELAKQLADSESAQRCFEVQLFRFALGRAEANEDECSLSAVSDVQSASPNMREIVVAITTSDAFRYARW